MSAVLEALASFAARGVPLRGRRIAVVVPDATRPLDPARAIAPLLSLLDARGARLSLTVALGLHRPMRDEELRPLAELAARFAAPLFQHGARDRARLIEAGEPIPAFEDGRGPPIPRIFAKEVAAADLIFVTGLVEPHQYAGFSGGAKAVAIGCAAAETIAGMHGLHYLVDPAMRIGEAEHNPFQRALGRLVAELPEIFALQITPSGEAFAGPWAEAFAAARRAAAAEMFEPVEGPLDWAILEVPPPKAQSFYQASRAATYAALVDRPAVRRGGTLIVEAACPEGIGEGEGEAACARAMSRGRDSLLAELRGGGSAGAISGGAQRAYVLARALEDYEIVLAGAREIPALAAMGIRQLDSPDRAGGLRLSGRGRRFRDPIQRIPRLS